MRPMIPQDLGDVRQFEDEAIREQAARLQVHLENLRKRINCSNEISHKTAKRLQIMSRLADNCRYRAEIKAYGV